MKTKEFFEKLVELFPDVATSGTYTRPQVQETVKALGDTNIRNYMVANKVARGVYQLPSAKKDDVYPLDELSVSSNSIPTVDPNFVPFGNYNDLESIISAGIFYPSYVFGPTGNGKSTMVEQICAQHNRSLIRVNLNMMTDEDQLIGSKTLKNGNVQIVEGPVLIAMRTGAVLLCDEIDAASANTIMCLQAILEGKPYYFKLKNETIIPKPGFNIIATANTKGKGSDDGRYIGTNILNEAFLERFAVTFEQEYPSAKIEFKIVSKLMEQFNCVDENFASLIVKWADTIRKTYDDGGVDELITTRRIAHIVRAFAIFKDQDKAIKLCCNRFDITTKTAFIDLYDKMKPDDTTVDVTTPSKLEEIPF